LITVSNNFTSSLSANNRLWKIKATITRNNTGAIPIDISDRINSCTINIDWERRSASASIELDNYDFSLSPINRTSTTNQVGGVFDPLLDSNHLIELYYGLLTVSGYEYIRRFTGYLGDEIDADTFPGIVQLTARDRSKLFQDTYIYQGKIYGSPPAPVEYVIQDMINTFASGNNNIVTVDSPTQYDIGTPGQPYIPKDTNLWDACQLISDVANQDFRFDEDGIPRLKTILRDFTGVHPVVTINQKDVIRDSISISDSDVRNHIVLRVAGLNPIEKKNDDSIARYGRRYMEVHRSLAYIITNLEQGNKLVDNFLRDLSYALPHDRIEMPLYPLIQAGDIVGVNNSKLGTDSSIDIFRVIQIKEDFSAKSKRSEYVLQGYSSVNIATLPAPLAPTNTNSQIINRTIQNYTGSGWTGNQRTYHFPLLTWNPPIKDVSGNTISLGFGGYSIYRQGPSDTSYKLIGALKSYYQTSGGNVAINYFYDYTAQAGTYLYKIVAVSQFGKRSTDSPVATVNVPATLTQ
jgi:hypothetical protein